MFPLLICVDCARGAELDGNNGLHLAEVRVDYGLGSDNYAVYSWILSELNGWLDGNSASPPSRTYDVASASPAIDGTGTAVDVTTVTGTRNNAQSGHTFMISFYGSNGHTIPTILSSGFENGATDSFSYDTGDLGDFCGCSSRRPSAGKSSLFNLIKGEMPRE